MHDLYEPNFLGKGSQTVGHRDFKTTEGSCEKFGVFEKHREGTRHPTFGRE